MKAGISSQDLRNCLALLEPIELKGMVLLREHRSQGQRFPRIGENGLTRETVAEAVIEVRQYVGRCLDAKEQLENLTPIPLTSFSILEYGL
jgi:hypothetical protein